MKTFFDSCVQKASNLIESAHSAEKSTNITIIVGLSGGPDSVFLLHVLNHLQKQNPKIKIIATHLDHQWRTESWRDIEFCSELCKKLNIEFIARKAEELNLDIKFNGSKEEIGRKMRRALFKQILKEKNADFIALAHQIGRAHV